MILNSFFDFLISQRYHNHRSNKHCRFIAEDFISHLLVSCPNISKAIESDGLVLKSNCKVSFKGKTEVMDVVIGECENNKIKPDGIKLVLLIKSIITAHRNRGSRESEIVSTMKVVQEFSPEAITIGIILVGTAEKVLNVPDRIKPLYGDEFEEILPRLSSGDLGLFDEFSRHFSSNSIKDVNQTITKFSHVPQRGITESHRNGFEFVLQAPVHIDNVSGAALDERFPQISNFNANSASMFDRINRCWNQRFGGSQ